MRVRGVVLQTRKAIVTEQFGSEAWAALYRDVALAHPCLRPPLTASSLVPLPAYLAFHGEMMRRLFRDDDESHFLLGAHAARWALRSGPLRDFVNRRDLADLVAALPELWPTFFVDTASHSEAVLEGDSVRFKAFDLPERHRYFEPFVVGYIKEVLELFCANPIWTTKIRGGDGTHYHYLFQFTPTRLPAAPHLATPRPDPSRRKIHSVPSLTDREAEVLLLLAEGKTNAEIGQALGISGKTAQHHIASVYAKIGVSGRVGAAVWLAERGLIGK